MAELVARSKASSQVSGMIRPSADMKVNYQETARDGLAVNVIEC